jgi:hypothetical protein
VKKIFLLLALISLLPACAGTPEQEADRFGRIATQVALETLEVVVPRQIEIDGSVEAGLEGGRGRIDLLDFDLDQVINVW